MIQINVSKKGKPCTLGQCEGHFMYKDRIYRKSTSAWLIQIYDLDNNEVNLQCTTDRISSLMVQPVELRIEEPTEPMASKGARLVEVDFQSMLNSDCLIKCVHSSLDNSINRYGVDFSKPMVFNEFLGQLKCLTGMNCKSLFKHARWFIYTDDSEEIIERYVRKDLTSCVSIMTVRTGKQLVNKLKVLYPDTYRHLEVRVSSCEMKISNDDLVENLSVGTLEDMLFCNLKDDDETIFTIGSLTLLNEYSIVNDKILNIHTPLMRYDVKVVK